MSYTVVFTPEAEAQLVELYGYISTESSAAIAERFTDGIVSYCESLRTLSARGNWRDDIRPGLRITNYQKCVTITFDVDDERINIIGVFYRGQDYESALLDHE